MILYVDVGHVAQTYPRSPVACRHHKPIIFVRVQMAHRLCHFKRKVIILYGLQNVVERLDLVALDRILREARYKNQTYACVQRAYALCRVHAVYIGHLNIHEDNIVLSLVLFKQHERRNVGVDKKSNVVLITEALEVILKCFARLFFVLNYCNADCHNAPPSFSSFYQRPLAVSSRIS